MMRAPQHGHVYHLYREPLTRAQLAAKTAERQSMAGYHREGLHKTSCLGCPYCYPEDPLTGDYLPPPRRPALA